MDIDMDDDTIDFSALEQELHSAIEEDAKYWRENDAKLRAVNQKVSSYDEFRNIVKAAHLKPLEKGDRISNTQAKKASIWNSIASKKKQWLDAEMSLQRRPQTAQLEDDCLPTTTGEFIKHWKVIDITNRMQFLKQIGPENLDHMLRTEIPVGILGEMVQALLPFPSNTSDIIFVVKLLELLSKAKRFNLSLQFLNSVEKTICKELMEKLNSSFQNRQQDLAEDGITEWTILELRNKYKV